MRCVHILSFVRCPVPALNIIMTNEVYTQHILTTPASLKVSKGQQR